MISIIQPIKCYFFCMHKCGHILTLFYFFRPFREVAHPDTACLNLIVITVDVSIWLTSHPFLQSNFHLHETTLT